MSHSSDLILAFAHQHQLIVPSMTEHLLPIYEICEVYYRGHSSHLKPNPQCVPTQFLKDQSSRIIFNAYFMLLQQGLNCCNNVKILFEVWDIHLLTCSSIQHDSCLSYYVHKYKMKYQSNTKHLFYVYHCTRATCFDSYRIIFRPF